MVSSVEVINPPMTTVASGRCSSAPAGWPGLERLREDPGDQNCEVRWYSSTEVIHGVDHKLQVTSLLRNLVS